MKSEGELRILGDFEELETGGTAGSLRAAVGAGPGQPTQRRTAFYLLQGVGLIDVMGMDADVLDGEDIYLSTSWCTDGDWAWRRDLAHYVAKYNVALPPEFLEHAARYRWSPGVIEEAEAAHLARTFAVQRGWR